MLAFMYESEGGGGHEPGSEVLELCFLSSCWCCWSLYLRSGGSSCRLGLKEAEIFRRLRSYARGMNAFQRRSVNTFPPIMKRWRPTVLILGVALLALCRRRNGLELEAFSCSLPDSASATGNGRICVGKWKHPCSEAWREATTVMRYQIPRKSGTNGFERG
jgi:hypothetical protein